MVKVMSHGINMALESGIRYHLCIRKFLYFDYFSLLDLDKGHLIIISEGLCQKSK